MIQLDTLGAPGLRREGTAVRSVLSQPKRLALLAYLAVTSPGGPVARERLLALFWPESDEERARNALRQALHYLRRSLGPEILAGQSEREVAVDPDVVRCDAVAFETAIAEGRPGEALEIYRGDFLDGLQVEEAPDLERWIDERRLRYRRDAVEAARAAADAERARGNGRAAVLLLRRGLAVDPFDEASIRRVVEILDAGGERAAALEAWEAFARRFREELGLEPSPETLSVAERLRAAPGDRVPADAAPVGIPAPAPPATGTAGVEPAPTAADRVRGTPSEPGPTGGRAPWWRSPGPALAAGLTAVAVVALLVRPSAPDVPPSEPGPPAIAVLPFQNLSGDPSQEFFSDGMAEEVMATLARVPGLRVVARTSAFSFKGQPVGVDSIGRALRVGHVLEGSVRMSGSDLRVTAKLVDAATGYQLWTDTYDGRLADVFEVQGAIARDIVRALEPRLGGSVPRRVPGTDDPEAYADLLRGLAALRLDAPRGYEMADSAFRRAVTRDPGYARAWAGLARVRVVDVYRRRVVDERGYQEARALAERALSLDPGEAGAHIVLGRIAEDHDWDFAAAEGHYRRALQLAPFDELGTFQLSRLLAHLGRVDESIALAEHAVGLDPLSSLAHRVLATSLVLSGRYERAAAEVDRALSLQPDADIARIVKATALAGLGRAGEAVAVIEPGLARAPGEPIFLGAAGWVAALAGQTERAREILARLEGAGTTAFYYRAMVLAGLGERDAALDMLERAVEAREPFIPQMAGQAAFAGFHGDPRFREILRRVGLEPRS